MAISDEIFGRLRFNGTDRPTSSDELINARHGIPYVRTDPFEVTANLFHENGTSSYSKAICETSYGTDWVLIPLLSGLKVTHIGTQSASVYEEINNGTDYDIFTIPYAPILRLELDGVKSWKGTFIFRLLNTFIDSVGGFTIPAGDYPCVYDESELTIVSFDGEIRAEAPVEIPQMRRSRAVSRTVDLHSWVPEYLRGEGIEALVTSFETFLNEMFDGAHNDPSIVKSSILDKIEGLSDLLDPTRVPIKHLHHVARNMGYDLSNSILRAGDLGNGSTDLKRYARMLVDSLPDIIRTKTTKDSMRGLLFCVGALANIYYEWTKTYDQVGRFWESSNENDWDSTLPMVSQQITTPDYYPTPHFSVDIDLNRYDLSVGVESMTDLLNRALEMIESIRPVNTVIDRLTVGIPVDLTDNAMTLVCVRGWSDSPWNSNPAEIPRYPEDVVDEGSGILSSEAFEVYDLGSGSVVGGEDEVDGTAGITSVSDVLDAGGGVFSAIKTFIDEGTGTIDPIEDNIDEGNGVK